MGKKTVGERLMDEEKIRERLLKQTEEAGDYLEKAEVRIGKGGTVEELLKGIGLVLIALTKLEISKFVVNQYAKGNIKIGTQEDKDGL